MNDRQRTFADAFLATGNAAEAARLAGYSPRTANRQGHRLLSNADIAEYLDAQRARLASERIADATEALETLTAVMRGEIADTGGREPALADRLRAANMLLRRMDAHPSVTAIPTIIDDIVTDVTQD